MAARTYLLYCVTCTVSRGQYIGITSRPLNVRRREHHRTKTGYQRNCTAFHAAIQKYGRDAFVWEVLIDDIEQNDAELLERFLISAMKPRYNVASGGLRGLGFAGSIRGPETIVRMRAAAKKRGVSPATRAALVESQRKHVVSVETGTVFRDAGEAAEAYGLKRSHVYDRIFKRRPSKKAGVTFRHALPHEVGMMNVREAV